MTDSHSSEQKILIPSFFPEDPFENRGKSIFAKRRRLTVSGIANISAKLFLLRKFLDGHPHIRNIVFLTENKNELHETAALAPLFLGDTDQWKFSILPFSERRAREKVEWAMAFLPENEIRHVFFCTVEDAGEYFPAPEHLQSQRFSLTTGLKTSAMQLFQQFIRMGYVLTTDLFLQQGEYRRSGNIVDVFPIGSERPLKIEISYDEIENIYEFFPDTKKLGKSFSVFTIYPVEVEEKGRPLAEILSSADLQIWNELEEIPEQSSLGLQKTEASVLEFSSFPEDDDISIHLRFLSVLKFYNLPDLLSDFREKEKQGWKTVVLTKRKEELREIFTAEKIPFSFEDALQGMVLLDAGELEVVPPSFQNPEAKIGLLTDREIFHLHGSRKKKITGTAVNVEFLTSLKVGDLVVHLDHGIGRFLGICEQEIDGHIREYLEIAYLHDDKLFVPVDQADKISRFISEEGIEPKLTRLGGVEWKNIQKKVKKETEKIAKELLQLYAKRARSKGFKFPPDTGRQREFEEQFPYEETPGQIAAIRDIKSDLESGKPMDRLLCGDVGFGKTEVSMRAAFKVVEAGRQVAFVAPITILVQQHYQTFLKRMTSFGVKVEMLSRFRTPAEQKAILADLEKGKIDVIIGTHRLLSGDVRFHDLGLVIIDEEQRFGVQQKERFKKMRAEISILTLSATPIPRTLNMALHKLRDISTITTPPPGRLPIITEVRKYSDRLIRESILKEKERGGQVYFLHNRVETIEAMAHKLRLLVPETSFVVAHGQMKADLLEDRILDFKEKKYDVLVSSTIIENGIDLPNANTLIVNNAEDFGLSQLYQLRGRIGRSKTQAYAYLLHSAQKLNINAKKRLKALIEASELGSGFQLSMRDLEIRGAGDILGVSQHGTINIVGVSHFLRLLQQTIKEMETARPPDGEESETTDVLIEIPIDAYIPGTYIADTKEKILMYQKLAAIQTLQNLRELGEEMAEEYGRIPRQVMNLFEVLNLKILAKKAFLRAIKVVNMNERESEVQLHLSKKTTAVEVMSLLKTQSYWMISGETLKTRLRNLEPNWLENLKIALQELTSKTKSGLQPVKTLS